MMKKLQADCAYIAKIHNKYKSGKTRSFARRFGRSQYNQGGFDNVMNDAYICQEGFESDIDRWEKIYKREYYNFLIRKKDNNKAPTEWIDEKFNDIINFTHIQRTMENKVCEEKLHIRKIKSEYLIRLLDDANFIHDVRANLEKYTDEIV